jgi:hypothetical protein
VAADATVNELGGLSGQVAADIGGGQLRPPHDRGIYDGDLAHARAPDRARRPLLAREPELRRILQDKVELEWSPAQIAPYLRAVQRRPHFVRVVIRQIENEWRRTGAHHPGRTHAVSRWWSDNAACQTDADRESRRRSRLAAVSRHPPERSVFRIVVDVGDEDVTSTSHRLPVVSRPGVAAALRRPTSCRGRGRPGATRSVRR